METERKRVLITGAAGFVGSHMVRAFQAARWHTVAALRSGGDVWRLTALADRGRRLGVVELDLQHPENFAGVLNGVRPDVVVHCAAYGVNRDQRDMSVALDCNVRGTARLVEAAAAAQVKRFIHLGTGFEYGSSDGLLTENAPLRPSGLYASTKAAGSLLAMEHASTLGLPLSLLRPFGLYGPLEGEHKLVPLVIRACLHRTPLDLTAGEQIRDYLYIEDLADACLLLAEKKDFPRGRSFNIASGVSTTIRTLGERIARVVGGAECLRWGALPYRPREELMRVEVDISRARKELGWRPTISVERGIQKTLQCMREERKLA